MILAGGGHILCSPQILGKDMASCTTVDIDAEKERFKAMCFILWEDETRYGDLLEKLKKGVYRGRNKYPNTMYDPYELLLWTSH